MTHKTALSGVFVPVVTPFEKDELRLDHLAANLTQLNRSGVRGYLALGSNGEFRSLSEGEQDLVLGVFADHRDNKVIMVGTGAESAAETIRRTNQAAAMGFPYASVLPPSYFAKHMSEEALYRFFATVADGAHVPIILYNAPQFANAVQLKPGLVVRLSEHPNIVGMKDSSSAGPSALLSVLDDESDFAVLAGSTNFFYPSLHLGATGGILSPANGFPDPCQRLYDLFAGGAYREAAELHRSLVRLNQSISGKYGVAGVKAATTLAGMQGGEPRLPLLPLGDAQITEIRLALEREGLL